MADRPPVPVVPPLDDDEPDDIEANRGPSDA